MGNQFPFPVYDRHIYEALSELQALSQEGIEQLRIAMQLQVVEKSER